MLLHEGTFEDEGGHKDLDTELTGFAVVNGGSTLAFCGDVFEGRAGIKGYGALAREVLLGA